MAEQQSSLIPVERILHSIYVIRGQKVMLDSDLAALYDVPIKRLNEQVKRNRERFPDDFMFQLTKEEAQALRSQFATLETGRGKYSKNDSRLNSVVYPFQLTLCNSFRLAFLLTNN